MLDIIIRQDGNMFMCAESDFTDIANSKSWWGKTPAEALNGYLKDKPLVV